MNELAAFILARVEEDHDLAYQALHDPGAGGILGAHTRNCHAAATGRAVDVAGHELLLDPLACHNMNQSPEKVIADCVAKQRLVAHVQSIDWDYEPAGAGLHAHHPRAAGHALARPSRLRIGLGRISLAKQAL